VIATGHFGVAVMGEKQVVQEGGEPSCRSARCPRNLSPYFPAAGGKTGNTATPKSPGDSYKVVSEQNVKRKG
jgi:hypothetical protein